jgi:CubicO group peptidase (beta-lactamase class C family)
VKSLLIALRRLLPAFSGLALLAAPALAQPAAPLQPGQPIPPPELAAFVDGVVERGMARDHVAGATVSVVQDGKIVFKRGYGMASLKPQRPVDPDRTLFRIGSITKTFTWISVMRQVEAGRMRLDAPVDTYLPPALRTGDGKVGAPILVRNLMDHSPGFEDHVFGVLFKLDPADVRPLDTWLAQERPARVRAPGQVSSYSNYGAALAGSAVAHVAGQEYETLVESSILGPLGMAHTTPREPRPARAGMPAPMPAALAPDVSASFHWTGTGYETRGFEYIGQVAPAGSMSSTAGDMARYMMMVLNGGELDGARIYGPIAAEAFRTPVRAVPPGQSAWLHGFYEIPLAPGYTGFGHDGGTMSFFSNMTLVPPLRLGVFVSTNTAPGGRFQADLAPAIVQHFYAPAATFPPAPSAELAKRPERFAGHYLATRRAYSGLEGFIGRVAFGSDVAVTPEGRLVTSGFGGNSTAYVPQGDPATGRFVPVDRTAAWPLLFQMRDGRATAILTSGSLFERTGPLDAPQLLQVLMGLTAAGALLTLLGLAYRPRAAAAGPRQRLAGRVEIATALLWLGSIGALLAYVAGAADQWNIVFGWPSPVLITASSLALAASLATLGDAVLAPLAWREAGWSWRRKTAFTVTALVGLALAGVLLRWGFLAPWSS